MPRADARARSVRSTPRTSGIPYSTIGAPGDAARRGGRAKGAWLTVIDDGRAVEIIDAMASWWTAIHGHGHPVLDAAMTRPAGDDEPRHVRRSDPRTGRAAGRSFWCEITPEGLDTVFFSDSGSVSVEVAVKMALQYQRSRGRPGRHRLMTWRGGYHGDTFTPMSVCDPDGGMHSLWTGRADAAGVRAAGPRRIRRRPTARRSRRSLRGMPTSSPRSSSNPWCRAPAGCASTTRATCPTCGTLCDGHDVLLIFDEIATGFGRTGALFAADHAGVSPDIMCVGKALTGGYLTLAATLCTRRDRAAISPRSPAR